MGGGGGRGKEGGGRREIRGRTDKGREKDPKMVQVGRKEVTNE